MPDSLVYTILRGSGRINRVLCALVLPRIIVYPKGIGAFFHDEIRNLFCYIRVCLFGNVSILSMEFGKNSNNLEFFLPRELNIIS